MASFLLFSGPGSGAGVVPRPVTLEKQKTKVAFPSEFSSEPGLVEKVSSRNGDWARQRAPGRTTGHTRRGRITGSVTATGLRRHRPTETKRGELWTESLPGAKSTTDEEVSARRTRRTAFGAPRRLFPNFLVLVGPLTAAHHHHQGRIARSPASPQQRERKGERLDGNQAQQRIEREKLL